MRIYDLVIAHEAREGLRFRSVLFARPDLAVVVPFAPACAYRHATAAVYVGDWLAWLPRAALEGAFRAMSDDFKACRMRFEGDLAALGPEGFMIEAARRHGVNMSAADEASHVIALVRPQSKTAPPSGFVCSQLARRTQLAAARTWHTRSGAITPAAAFHAVSYRGKAGEGSYAKDLPTCTRLLISNPSNQ